MAFSLTLFKGGYFKAAVELLSSTTELQNAQSKSQEKCNKKHKFTTTEISIPFSQ